MVHTYVPILRWKQGERRGIAQLQPSAKRDVLPLFKLASEQYRPPRGRNLSGTTSAQAFATDVLNEWGTSPFFLDASEVSQSASAANHPLVDIATSARALGLALIPATQLGATAGYNAAVQAVAATDGRGVALRVDLQELASASAWAGSWFMPLSETDLIADFRGSIGTVLNLGAPAIAAFQSLHRGSAWRSVTVAGTSIPPDFSGYSAGVHLIPRSEWALWQALSTAGLPYRIDFGDFATVSLAAPPPGIAWGYPINVKYTLQNEFLVCRGVKTTGRGSVDMAPQLIQHARTISIYPTRSPIAGCWADALIDDIAAGIEGPGALETWVRIGVNRHIERVRLDLP